jgi:hypothetical protein
MPELTRAQHLAESLYPWTYEGALRVVRAYLAEPQHGDASPELVYELVTGSTMSENELQQFPAEVARLRAEHFAALGQPLPTWRGWPLI